MPPRTGLAATLTQLLTEFGVRHAAGSPRTTADATTTTTEHPVAGQDDEPPPVTPAGPETVAQPADAIPSEAVPAPAADTPAVGSQPELPRQAGFLRRVQTIALWLRDGGLALAGYTLILVVSGSGWKASFVGLHEFAMQHMGFDDLDAWCVPITFDGAALALTLSVARAAMSGRSAAIRRLGVIGFTLLSSGINYIHITDLRGREVAALLPIAAVTVFESLMAEARKAYERRTGNVRPRLSILRWVFDFRGTKAILRAYVLGIPLPSQMAEAAETVVVEPKATKRRRRRGPQRRTAKTPADKRQTGAPENEAMDGQNEDRAPVIDIALVREFGEKSAHAITLWLDSIRNGRELSLRQIDKKIKANGIARHAVPKYIAAHGDPREEAVNA